MRYYIYHLPKEIKHDKTIISPYAPIRKIIYENRTSVSIVEHKHNKRKYIFSLFACVVSYWYYKRKDGRSGIMNWSIDKWNDTNNDTLAKKNNCYALFAYYWKLLCSLYPHKKNKLNSIPTSMDTNQITRSILSYWFTNKPLHNLKQKWMISSENKTQQSKIDKEIYTAYNDILERMWECYKLYGNAYLETTWYTNWENCAAFIILLDQFSRHIQRHKTQSSWSIHELNNLATQSSQYFLHTFSGLIGSGYISTPILIFVLMPLRHIPNKEEKEEYDALILKCIKERKELQDEDMDVILKRFYSATVRRLDHCDADEDDILDHPDSSHTIPKDLMEKQSGHRVIQTLEVFLNQQGISPNTSTPVYVSLSGGVDSMVILSALHHLQQHQNYTITIIALHINYNNRKEVSIKEANYLQQFCKSKADYFELFDINEMKRDNTPRDEYERYTREIRFNFYKDMQIKYGPSGVMLGHHKGDIQENVLSNTFKGASIFELSGMKIISTVQKIVLWRPLLSIPKDDIYHYAHMYGIPYFKDTTPNWSTRGKIRNKLLPLVKDIYGDGCIKNLSNLACESDNLHDLFTSSFIQPFQDNHVSYHPLGIKLYNLETYKSQPLFFWKILLRNILHQVGFGMMNDDMLQHTFLKALNRKSNKRSSDECWLQCRKDYGIYMNGDHDFYFFFRDCFPWGCGFDEFVGLGELVPFVLFLNV